jgi:hypothetical protein
MQPRHLLLLFTFSGIIVAGCSSAPAAGAGGFGGTASTTSGPGGASTSTTGTTATTSGGGAGGTTTTSSSTTGTSSSGGTSYSCSYQSAITAYCNLYEGLTSEEMTSDMEGCAALAGTSGTSCPSANALGTCTETALGVTEITTYYSGTMTTAAEAQETCVGMGGTWTAS